MKLKKFLSTTSYEFTASVKKCKASMLKLGANNLTHNEIAEIISILVLFPTLKGQSVDSKQENKPQQGAAKTLNGFKADVFVRTIKDMQPDSQWVDVISALDRPNFKVPDGQSLKLLINILKLGLRVEGYPPKVFPVEYIYQPWNNVMGQLSLITSILENPDIFSFSDHLIHPIPIDMLIVQPEDTKEINVWRSIDLVDTLLEISDKGHKDEVKSLLDFPIKTCPDILFLCLLNTEKPVNQKEKKSYNELFTLLFKTLIDTEHVNIIPVMLHAWERHSESMSSRILAGLGQWDVQMGGPKSAAEIIEVANDLKLVPILLLEKNYMSSFNLAVLATERGYLNLDEWLAEKIGKRGETFVTNLLIYFKMHAPIDNNILLDTNNMSILIVKAILNSLLLDAVTLNSPTAEEIRSIVATYQLCNATETLQFPLIFKLVNFINASQNNNEIPLPLNSNEGSNIDSPLSNIGNFDRILQTPQQNQIVTPSNANFTIPSSSGNIANLTLRPTVPLPTQNNLIVTDFPDIICPTPIRLNTFISLEDIFPSSSESFSLDEHFCMYHYQFPCVNSSAEIEKASNTFFRRLYSRDPNWSLTVNEVLGILKSYKNSIVLKEREIVSCICNKLFSEYWKYPTFSDFELYVTARLFGGLIEFKMVSSRNVICTALRLILNGLGQPFGSKMCSFGLEAIRSFEYNLHYFASYCEFVRAIPHYPSFPYELREYIEFGVDSRLPPSKVPVGHGRARRVYTPNAFMFPPLETSENDVILSQPRARLSGLPALTSQPYTFPQPNQNDAACNRPSSNQ